MPPHSGEIELCEHPIFVVGAPRSGTTGLARALARHKRLWTSAETLFLHGLFRERRLEHEYERWVGRPQRTWLRKEEVELDEFLSYLGLGINALLTSRSEGKRWIDHTPVHGMMIETLAAMFPGAYFLHILRDGRSSVHSMVHVGKRLDPDLRTELQKANFLPAWTRDFGAACRVWRESVESALTAAERWPDRCLTVTHAELGTSPDDTFRKMFAFVGVPFQSKPVEVWQTRRVNSSFKGEDPVDPSARWEQWSPEQRETFLAEAGPTLVRSGLASADELNVKLAGAAR